MIRRHDKGQTPSPHMVTKPLDEKPGHHLVLGKLVDFITNKIIPDTHDERYRQRIARLLVTSKQYRKDEVISRQQLIVDTGERRGRLNIDFQVRLNGRVGMVIQYGPGSLTTRHRPGLAIARLATSYQIPVVVVTNGEAADILEGKTGHRVASGLDAIPDRQQLIYQIQHASWEPLGRRRAQMEARILYCFEIDGRCACDDTACQLE
jgi:hypothetical protein